MDNYSTQELLDMDSQDLEALGFYDDDSYDDSCSSDDAILNPTDRDDDSPESSED